MVKIKVCIIPQGYLENLLLCFDFFFFWYLKPNYFALCFNEKFLNSSCEINGLGEGGGGVGGKGGGGGRGEK
jgi:hypothetical protein